MDQKADIQYYVLTLSEFQTSQIGLDLHDNLASTYFLPHKARFSTESPVFQNCLLTHPYLVEWKGDAQPRKCAAPMAPTKFGINTSSKIHQHDHFCPLESLLLKLHLKQKLL